MNATFDPSLFIHGNFPVREMDAEDLANPEPRIEIRIPRGFETLDIAVYGHGLTKGDAEESAFEFLLEHYPNALTDAEKEAGEIDSY